MEAITANQLRVGNYLILDGKVIQITGFSPESNSTNLSGNYLIVFKPEGSDREYECEHIEFSPIELTEEWLERNDFMVRNKSYSLNVGGELMRYALYEEIREDKRIRFIIYFSKRHGWTLDSVANPKETFFFNTVHEMQNVFRWNIGEELKIKE